MQHGKFILVEEKTSDLQRWDSDVISDTFMFITQWRDKGISVSRVPLGDNLKAS